MRQEQPVNNYAAGTKVDSHGSRAELARLLARYGASDFVVLEHDADATIRFALHGKYVQYLLPLPDLDSPSFTHTPTGRPRSLDGQERAYEQAMRQQWRRAVLVMRGKLEAVESGLSTFEREFYGAIAEEKRERPAALLLRRRMRWAPETMLLVLCLGVFVPASGGMALGLPLTAVDKVTSPFWGDQPDQFGASDKRSGASLHLASGAKVVVAGNGELGTPSHSSSRSNGSGGSSATSGGSSKPPGGSGGGSAGSGGSNNGSSGGTGGSSGGASGGSGNSGGSSGGSSAPPPGRDPGGSAPPPTPPPPPPSGDKTPYQGVGSQGKGQGLDNGNKGGAGGASGKHK